jgi:integrase
MVVAMARSTRRQKRPRGNIEQLPSGALRVRVYAGIDPVSKRRHYLREVIPPGPKADAEAQRSLTRLLNEVDERRNPRTNATLNQLLDKYLGTLDRDPGTLSRYRGHVDNHIGPLIGGQKVGDIDADILDSFYAELRRCRVHCTGRKRIDHRTPRPHECDERCRPHTCKPLAPSTVRQIHFLLSGAYKRAVRWRWVQVNPVDQAEPPPPQRPNPQPPSAADAARLLNETWTADADWGTFVWLAMTTGARRGELCALRWRHVDLDHGVLTLERSISQDDEDVREKDTKTHQQRRVALDPETVAALAEHRSACEDRAAALGTSLDHDAFVFSLTPDGSTHLLPRSVTQRYRRLTQRLGIDSHLHTLRHYSATELIRAGVDVRTVAGRLGHGGGGATTLRVYAAWISESDQRAASTLFGRMPARPQIPASPAERAKTDPRSPYERIAAEIRQQILNGALQPGDPAPTVAEIAATHGVSEGTAHRAMVLLKTWELITASRGRRAVVSWEGPRSA